MRAGKNHSVRLTSALYLSSIYAAINVDYNIMELTRITLFEPQGTHVVSNAFTF